MNVLLLNDTSSYHSGCKKVIEYIKADIHNCGYKLIESFGSNVKNIQEAHTFIDKVDLVILNGEGSMHHNHRETPTKLLEVLGNAKGQGKKTALINTVWQEMKLDDRTIEVLKDSYVSCREIKSAQEFYKNKIDADIYLDLSYFCDVLPLEYDFSDIVVGRFFGTEYKREDAKVIDIFKDSWDVIVNKLRKANWFITGRHHEMYAACKAKCPFVVVSGNTWKNQALLETAKVSIPFAKRIDQIPTLLKECQQYESEYDYFFNWMDVQPRFTLKGKIK